MALKSSWTPEYNQSDMVKRDNLRDYIEAQNACYEKEHGVKAGSSLQKFWKRAFRKMHKIKDCTRTIHNLTRSNTHSVRKKKILHKPKAKPEGGNPHQYIEHVENWNQKKNLDSMESVTNRKTPRPFQSWESIQKEKEERKRNMKNEIVFT